MTSNSENRSGLAYGIIANVLWGLLPLYLNLLRGVDALQVLSHRVVWSLIALGLVLHWLKRVRATFAAAKGRTLGLLAVSAGLIAVNWFVYIWSAAEGHLVEASIGYFIIPLVSVALGATFLGERLTWRQAVAVGIAGFGVLILIVSGGSAIWISLTLALSFGLYGLIRKLVTVDALGGLAIETVLLTPFALIFLVYVAHRGDAAFGHHDVMDGLLILAGPLTAMPLLFFAAAAKRLRLATVGLLQFIAPTLLFVQATILYDEPVRSTQLPTFSLIWIGCGLYAWSSTAADVK